MYRDQFSLELCLVYFESAKITRGGEVSKREQCPPWHLNQACAAHAMHSVLHPVILTGLGQGQREVLRKGVASNGGVVLDLSAAGGGGKSSSPVPAVPDASELLMGAAKAGGSRSGRAGVKLKGKRAGQDASKRQSQESSAGGSQKVRYVPFRTPPSLGRSLAVGSGFLRHGVT